MSGGGKGGSDYVAGYRYYMGMHIALCHGPVDNISKIIVGERVAWEGNVTSSSQIYVDAYNLFGGEDREGGVRGYVEVMMGEEDQRPGLYLSKVVEGSTSYTEAGQAFIAAILHQFGNYDYSPTLNYTDSSTKQVVYQMIVTPDISGNVNYVVTKSVLTNNGQFATTQLINTTYPANSNAESDAGALFVRAADTSVSTDGLTGVTTYQTIIEVNAVPAFRGITSLVFKRFMWSMINPYFKPIWFNLKRISKGWFNDAPWYSAKIQIGDYDMNPAHIIYQAMTDPVWGMGANVADFNDALWRAAADKLYAEGFGLSMMWRQDSSIQSFIQLVCDHINGAVRLNMISGLYELVLFRDDYVVTDLTELNVDNIKDVTSFQRAAWGSLCGEVVVNYTTRDDQTTTIAVQDPAAIMAQSGKVSTTRDYPGIRSDGLALRVAMRDLRVLSSPLAKVSLKCNRVLWDREKGDLFRLTWEPLGITNLAMRITDIDKGTLTDGWITVEAMEDVFGMPATTYAANNTAAWVDPITQATHTAAYSKLIEMPYWDVLRNTPTADFNALPADFAFAHMFSRYGAGSSQSFDLMSSFSNTSASMVKSATGHYSNHGVLANTLGYTDTKVYYNNALTFSADIVGKYAYIDNECVAIDAINTNAYYLTVRRGVLDTIPAKHTAGTAIWVNTLSAPDTTIHESGETVYYRICPKTASGTLAVGSAPSVAITFNGRAQRPYPPGQFKITGAYYPARITSPLTASWAHRDRTQQTVNYNDYTYGNVGPETGTTYTLKVLKPDGTVLRTITGLTGTSWSYDILNDIADGCQATVRLQLSSVRDSLSSSQTHDLTVDRYGLGLRLGQHLGTFA